MKKLKDEVCLIGKCETITMMDSRKHPGEILNSVCLGKQYIITKAGKKIALLWGLNVKPKIETLEKILDESEKVNIEIMPDGSLMATK